MVTPNDPYKARQVHLRWHCVACGAGGLTLLIEAYRDEPGVHANGSACNPHTKNESETPNHD